MSDDGTPYCLNDHRHGPAVGEALYGMAGDDEIVALLCAGCLYAGRDDK